MKSLPLLFLIVCSSCGQTGNNSWVIQKDHHDQTVSCAKIHLAKLPHRGFDVVWQQNKQDQWILLETSSFYFENLDSVDVAISSENKRELFRSSIRKGGQIIQLPPEALLFLQELQKEHKPFTMQVGPLSEELSWDEHLSSVFDQPYLKPLF